MAEPPPKLLRNEEVVSFWPVEADGSTWAVPALHGHPTLNGNDRSPRHLNWSEPWASAVPLVSEAGDQ